MFAVFQRFPSEFVPVAYMCSPSEKSLAPQHSGEHKLSRLRIQWIHATSPGRAQKGSLAQGPRYQPRYQPRSRPRPMTSTSSGPDLLVTRLEAET